MSTNVTNRHPLTNCEQILICTTILVVTLSISLALCISIVLPYHWTSDNYFKNNTTKSPEELYGFCKCFHLNDVNNFKCEYSTFPNRRSRGPPKCPNCPIKYPYLVSLTIKSYQDDESERKFACSGTILSSNWVLVGNRCVQENSEWTTLMVRAGSNYWSKGGKIYNISSWTAQEKLVALKVEPSFEFNGNIRPIKFSITDEHEWICATSAGWSQDSYNKYQKNSFKKWTRFPSSKTSKMSDVVKKETNENDYFDGKALVTRDGFLIGLQLSMDEREKNVFMDLQINKYKYWLHDLITNSERNAVKRRELNEEKGLINIYETKKCKRITSTSRQEAIGTKSTTELTTTTTTENPPLFPMRNRIMGITTTKLKWVTTTTTSSSNFDNETNTTGSDILETEGISKNSTEVDGLKWDATTNFDYETNSDGTDLAETEEYDGFTDYSH